MTDVIAMVPNRPWMGKSVKVAVTGGTGFIGRQLVNNLCELGHLVRVLCRPSSDTSVFASGKPEIIHGDMRDTDSLRTLVQGCEAVYHLAAGTKAQKWDEVFDITVRGTQRLVEVCQRSGTVKKLVHVSSFAVYDHASLKNRVALDETVPIDSPQTSRTLYARSKIMAEQALSEAMQAERPTIIIVRPALVYGPGAAFSPYAFPSLRGIMALALGDLRRKMWVVHVEDLADALILALRCPEPGIYHIADPASPSLREYLHFYRAEGGFKTPLIPLPFWAVRWVAPVADLAWRLFRHNREPLNASARTRSFCTAVTLDLRKATEQLGWAPQVAFEEGIRRAVAAPSAGQG